MSARMALSSKAGSKSGRSPSSRAKMRARRKSRLSMVRMLRRWAWMSSFSSSSRAWRRESASALSRPRASFLRAAITRSRISAAALLVKVTAMISGTE